MNDYEGKTFVTTRPEYCHTSEGESVDSWLGPGIQCPEHGSWIKLCPRHDFAKSRMTQILNSLNLIRDDVICVMF